MSLYGPYPCCDHCNFFHIHKHENVCRVMDCDQYKTWLWDQEYEKRAPWRGNPSS